MRFKLPSHLKIRKRQKRRQRFTDLTGYRGDRLILGFYYYLHEEEYGDRNKGWLMFAVDKGGSQ